jgi:hypothetical protein
MILFSASLATGEEKFSAAGSVSPNTITIGDLVTYDIALSLPPGYTLQQRTTESEIGPWTVRASTVTIDPTTTAPHLRYTLTTFTTGQVIIPSLRVAATTPNGTTAEVAIDSVTITVQSVLPQKGTITDIRDIKPPLTVPIPLSTYLLWFAILVAVAAGIYFWRQAARKKAGRAPDAPKEPPVPPYQKALQDLEALKNSSLVADGKIKEYYSALMDIIRTYIGAVYQIETMDRTSGEIYTALRGKESDKRFIGTVKDFFDVCDLVKFAKYRPDAAVCAEDWESAKKIVEAQPHG